MQDQSAPTTMDAATSRLVRPDLVQKNYGSASNLAFNEHIKQCIQRGQTIFHFGFGQSPFPVMEVARDCLHKYSHVNSYLPVQGIPELRKGICDFHIYYDSLAFDPSHVIVSPGSKELILLLMTVFCGDVLINSPAWTTYQPQASLTGRAAIVLESSQEEGWKVTPQSLEKALSSPSASPNNLLIFTNPCNPTGAAYTDQELEQLSLVLRKYNVTVLSDEIYGRLHYDGNHRSLCKYYPEGTILSSGLSKWASAGGWRMGYNIFPKELSDLFTAVKSAASHSYSCAPAPMQYAAAEMFQNLPACDDYIKHTSRIMKAVAEYATRELRSVGVSISTPCAGYYMFPNFEVIRPALKRRGVQTCQQMCELMLEEASVAVLAGGPHHLRPINELTTRLCYVNFDGTKALEESRSMGLEGAVTEEFLHRHCAPMCDGIKALKTWVVKLTDS